MKHPFLFRLQKSSPINFYLNNRKVSNISLFQIVSKYTLVKLIKFLLSCIFLEQYIYICTYIIYL